VAKNHDSFRRVVLQAPWTQRDVIWALHATLGIGRFGMYLRLLSNFTEDIGGGRSGYRADFP